MIRLAARLTAAGGRESSVRLLLTSLGLALTVALLLFAAVGFPALHAHDARRAWRDTSEGNAQPAQDESTTDPLLWRLSDDRYQERSIARVDLAAEGPDAPVPPGLDALPGPGELAMSPALQELVGSTDPALLGDRFPGVVTATVGREALTSPDDLVVFVGHAADELRSQPDVISVDSIEAAPISRDMTRMMRVALVIGGAGLLTPIVVFVATATRLAAARREKRLAAMQLAGATHRQISLIGAVEAAIAAIGGTALGFASFFALRPWMARIPFDGDSFYPSDLRLSLTWAAIVGCGVPLLAVGAAVLSLRRLRISPLGVARQSTTTRATPRPLLLVALGLVGLVVFQTTMRHASDVTAALSVGGVFVAMIVGIARSGPWLTSVVGRVVRRLGRRAPSLLAARRLEDNPAAGFRAISGLVLAVFVCTVFAGLAASILADQDVGSTELDPDVVVAAFRPQASTEPAFDESGQRVVPAGAAEWPELPPAQTARLVNELGAIDGVSRVVTVHAPPDDPALREALQRANVLPDPNDVLARCDDAAAIGLGFAGCEGTTVLNIAGHVASAQVTVTEVVPPDALAALPVVSLAAVTDGSDTAMEQARTRLTGGWVGGLVLTQDDIDAEIQKELRNTKRISNIGMAVTLVIAGCSLAVAVAGAIVERKQPFALLRLAGIRLSELRRVVLAEAAAPLLMVAGASVGLGLAVTALSLEMTRDGPAFTLPGLDYWVALVGGLTLALLVVLSTMPLLGRLTSLDSARFE